MSIFPWEPAREQPELRYELKTAASPASFRHHGETDGYRRFRRSYCFLGWHSGHLDVMNPAGIEKMPDAIPKSLPPLHGSEVYKDGIPDASELQISISAQMLAIFALNGSYDAV